MNLHELVNAPGAGRAEKILKSAGLWQEVSDDGLPVWKVEVAITKIGWTHVNVAAVNAEEAKEAAERFCRDNPARGDCFDEYERTDFEAVKAKPTHEKAEEP
jgi:hypothetical protein